MYRLKASFTIEASYVIAITMFCITNLILTAYKEHARVTSGFVNHTAAEAASCIEEKYRKEEFDIESIEEYVRYGLSGIRAVERGNLEVGRNKKIAWSKFSAGELHSDIEYKIHNPERFMRIISLLEGIYESNKDGIQEEPEE